MKFDVEFVIKRPQGNLRISKEMQSKNLQSLLLHLSAINYHGKDYVVGISAIEKPAEEPGCTVRNPGDWYEGKYDSPA